MKDINLFQGIKKSGPVKKSSQSVAAGLALLIVCAALVGGLYFWLSTEKNTLQSQIDAANAQINASQSMDSGDVSAKQARLAAARTYNAMLTALDENIAGYPKLDAVFLADLQSRMPAGVAVMVFDYKDGFVTLNCMADDADAPANFADAISKSGSVETVMIANSQIDAETEIATGVKQYTFTLEVYLKGGAAK